MPGTRETLRESQWADHRIMAGLVHQDGHLTLPELNHHLHGHRLHLVRR